MNNELKMLFAKSNASTRKILAIARRLNKDHDRQAAEFKKLLKRLQKLD